MSHVVSQAQNIWKKMETNIHKFEPADCRTHSRAKCLKWETSSATNMLDDRYIFFQFSQNGMISAQVCREQRT